MRGAGSQASRIRAVIIAVLGTGLLALTACSSGSQTGAVGTPSGSPTTQPTQSGVFVSALYHYSVDVPAGWTVVKATRTLFQDEYPYAGTAGVDTLVGPGGGKPGKDHTAIVVGGQLLSGWSLKDWTSKTASDTRVDGCHAVSKKRITVGSEPADLVDYSGCFGGVIGHLLWVTVMHGSRAFHIIWLATPGEVVQAKAQLSQTLTSFTFTA